MAKRKIYKNPEISDDRRDKIIKRRVMEEKARATEIWGWTYPRNNMERYADYIRYTKIDHHVTPRIAKGVIFGYKYGTFDYPKTKEEKWDDKVGLGRIYAMNHYIRDDDENFPYLSIGTEILHEDPDTKDKDYPIFNFNAERTNKKKISVKEMQLLTEWENLRNELNDSRTDITEKTVKRAKLTDEELRTLEREAMERRRNRKANKEDEEDENK